AEEQLHFRVRCCRGDAVGDRDRGEVVARTGGVVVYGSRDGGDRAAVHRHLSVGLRKLVERGRGTGPIRVGDDRRVRRDRERARASTWTVGRREVLATIGVCLREVPGREIVISVVAAPALAFPRQVLEGDRPAGGRATARDVQPEPLRRYLILGVLRVLRVQDPVDPALRNAVGRVDRRRNR